VLLPLLLNNLLEPEEGVDGLLANDVESASEVSSPSLGQVHALNATDVQSTSSVTTAALGQIHVLAANDIESASEVSEPALEEITEHALLANDVESASQVSVPALGQVHVLLANDVQSASEVSRPALDGATGVVAEPVTGGGRRRRPRKRYYVEIDGQYFEVDSQAEGEQLLRKAMSLAAEVATSETERAARRIKRGKSVAPPAQPTINASPELLSLVDDYRERINAIYRQIAVDAEIRELMRLRMLEDDEDDAIAALLVLH